MSMGTIHKCERCGCELDLDCGETIIRDDENSVLLDLILTCNNCDAPPLNAFVPMDDFSPIDGWSAPA